jgi:hypothetical protein
MHRLTKGRVAAAVLGATAMMLVAGQVATAGVAAENEPQRVEIQATSAGFVPDTVRLIAGRGS